MTTECEREKKCCIVGHGMWIGESASLVQTRRIDTQAVNIEKNEFEAFVILSISSNKS